MVTLILVRHGFSVANKENYFAGHTDIPLADVGFEQAKRVCDYVCKNYKPDKVYSSPLLRCVQTVEGISTTLSIPLILDDGLIELEVVKLNDLFSLIPINFDAGSLLPLSDSVSSGSIYVAPTTIFHFSKKKKKLLVNSLAVWQLGLHAFTAKGLGSLPG